MSLGQTTRSSTNAAPSRTTASFSTTRREVVLLQMPSSPPTITRCDLSHDPSDILSKLQRHLHPSQTDHIKRRMRRRICRVWAMLNKRYRSEEFARLGVHWDWIRFLTLFCCGTDFVLHVNHGLGILIRKRGKPFHATSFCTKTSPTSKSRFTQTSTLSSFFHFPFQQLLKMLVF